MATDQVVGACALDCPDGCSWVVTREDGMPVKLRGNADHPFSRGGLCVKVNSYLEHTRHPDRLLRPLRRIGAKGAGQFEEISWEEALAEIADRFRATIDAHGGESIWPYGGTGSVGLVQGIVGAGKRLFHHLGASRHLATICSVAGNVGTSYTAGHPTGFDPEDLHLADLVVLWGTNPLVSGAHLWTMVEEARAKGAPVVVIDPLRTRTARRSDHHLSPRPGTDGALALGLMARLLEDDAIDHDFLEHRTIGWDAFRDQVLANWSVERAAAITEVPAGQIDLLAGLVAASPTTAIKSSMGMQRHAGGGQAVRLLTCISAMTGDYQRAGGGTCYSTGAAYRIDLGALTRPDLQPGPTRSVVMTRLADTLLSAEDPPIRAIMMWGANPVVSNPDANRVQEALRSEDLFHVVVEHFMTDTARFADIVLPGTMQTEHVDLNDSFHHLNIHWNAKAAEPLGDCRSHTEIFRGIAAAMGLEEPALYATDEELAEAALGAGHPALEGIDLEAVQRRGWVRMNYPSPYVPFGERFETLSGKFEFASDRAEADGLGRLPDYLPPLETSGAGLALVSPADPRRLNSVFGHRQDDDPIIDVSAHDADQLGLEAGAAVRVENGRGSFDAVVRVSDLVRPGIVSSTKGAWMHGRASALNATVAERDSDIGRGAVYHDNIVRLVPVVGHDDESEPVSDAGEVH